MILQLLYLFAGIVVLLAAIVVSLRAYHRVGNCWGLTLWAASRRVELWVCFGEVPSHSHPGQDVEIIPLFGWATFCRVKPHRTLNWKHEKAMWHPGFRRRVNALLERAKRNTQRVNIIPRRWFHGFTIPSGWTHYFILEKFRMMGTWQIPLVFLNITRGPSAAENFITTRT